MVDTGAPARDLAPLVLHHHHLLVPGLVHHPEKGTGILEAVPPRAPVHGRLLVLLLASVDAAAPDHDPDLKPDHDPDRYAALVRVHARLSRTGESLAADGRAADRRS